ncbi:hypothetical protein Barb6_01878 [Bacteroidales bacterium Barb6]|nr:hypothetical protein Barb4_02639 [Bacteroidales bacterium Barb4]OAV69762.1 hypothetical protein Barb6_01878 [Bacteroidales bacterium Barb6]
MRTLALDADRTSAIQDILNVRYKSTLEEIKKLIYIRENQLSEESATFFQLSQEDLQSILDLTLFQIENGQTLSQEEMIKEHEAW